jgi:Cu(I)/Ag(I) efflux system protein CusF
MKLAALIAATLVVTSGAAFAADAAKPMAGMNHGPPSGGMVMADGVGVVRAVDVTGGMVTIEHAPIAALKWPAMTMKMKATPPTILKGVSVGQSVKFKLMQMGDATEVTSIQPK